MILGKGEEIVAYDTLGKRLDGTVDVFAADLGCLWIRTTLGERKLLDVFEHVIRPVRNSRPKAVRF